MTEVLVSVELEACAKLCDEHADELDKELDFVRHRGDKHSEVWFIRRREQRDCARWLASQIRNRVPSVCDKGDLLERFAAIAHEAWAGWTKWMLDCLESPDRDKHIARWMRQIATPYEDLSEKEKDSDRVEARKYLSLLGA